MKPEIRYLKVQGGWVIEKITQDGHPIKITRTLTPFGEKLIKAKREKAE